MAEPSSQERKGVPDWDDKLRLFKDLLDVPTDKALMQKVLEGTDMARQAAQMASNGYPGKWRESWPTQFDAEFFIKMLVAALPTRDTVTYSMLLRLRLQEYIDRLPDDPVILAKLEMLGLHKGMRSQSTMPASSAACLDDDDSFYPIFTHDAGPVETIKTGLLKGRVDQRHYYIDPDSASAWSLLVRADAYPTYVHCKTGLEVLVKSQQWKEAIAKCKPLAIVMLAGGGAPTKDLIFVEDLLGQSHVDGCISLHLVDISSSMLRESRQTIRDNARLMGFAGRIDVQLICDDVLRMTSCGRDLFHRNGSTVFAITGGTIGNFSEKSFFRSLNRVACPGDLLVISADTVGDLSADEENSLIEKYDNPDLQHFLRSVVGAVLGVSNPRRESSDDAMKRIAVRLLRPTDEDNPSDVPNSYCVLVTLEISGRNVTLVSSTRYRPSEIKTYAAQCGWESLGESASPKNEHFKQFLFCRNRA